MLELMGIESIQFIMTILVFQYEYFNRTEYRKILRKADGLHSQNESLCSQNTDLKSFLLKSAVVGIKTRFPLVFLPSLITTDIFPRSSPCYSLYH